MNDTLAGRNQGGPVRVFVSYSHDGEEHAKAVRRLSDRLRAEGVDSDLDQYHMSPAEGWPAWMENGVRDARFVVVVCSEGYLQKLDPNRETLGGHGVAWEGAIVRQSIYDANGRNEKFLPVIMRGADESFIPVFLRGATRYNTDLPAGYVDLYRRLTNQPAVVKPELGKVRTIDSSPTAEGHEMITPISGHAASSAGGWRDVVGLMSDGGFRFFNNSTALVRGMSGAVLTIRADDDSDAAYLADIQKLGNRPVGVGYRADAFLGRVTDVQRSVDRGQDTWQVLCTPIENDYGAGMMEISTEEFSADKLAELRARRILLNETGLPASRKNRDDLNDAMLEVFVRGQSTPLKIIGSPLPMVFNDLKDDPEKFIAVARVYSAMLLRFAGVVERVQLLQFKVESGERIRVEFEGTRPKKYANVPPSVISVNGELNLAGSS